jgi:hypothetical protein
MSNTEKPTENEAKTPPPAFEHMIRSPHTEDMIDHYWGSINYIFGLIKASEIKAGLILSFYGILLNFIYQKIEFESDGAVISISLYFLIGLWFVCLAMSIYYCIRCFMPKIEGTYEKNIFFFRDVITKFGNIKEFSKTFYKISLNEEELFDHMGQQIFIISKIAAAKFKYVNMALRFLALGLFLLLILVVYFTILIIK